MKILIGSDHGGLKLKNIIVSFLETKSIDILDVGCFSENSCDYPDYALKVAEQVAKSDEYFGILLCGTGMGMSIAANKVPGIRAALCHNTEYAKLSKEHNNANILCLGSRFLNEQEGLEIVDTWINTSFNENDTRHVNRINKISNIEKIYNIGGK